MKWKMLLLFAAAATGASVFLVLRSGDGPKDANASVYKAYVDFKLKYNRFGLSPAEDAYRFDIFRKNMAKIEQVNSNPSSKYKLGVNQFADMNLDEIEPKYLGLKDVHQIKETRTQKGLGQDANFKSKRLGRPELQERDWSVEDGMHPVVHQQSCASCYAFAANCALEHLYY